MNYQLPAKYFSPQKRKVRFLNPSNNNDFTFPKNIHIADKAFYFEKCSGYNLHIQALILNEYQRIITNDTDAPLFSTRRRNANLLILNNPKPHIWRTHEQLLEIAQLKVQKALSLGETSQRLLDESFYIRQLKREDKTNSEKEMLRFNAIKKYSSKIAQATSRDDAKRSEKFLAQRYIVVNDKKFFLNNIASKGTENKVYEALNRITALAKIATKNQWEAMFCVVTCPSRFHRASKKWDGSTPQDAQKFLQQKWQRIRASMKKDFSEGVDYMGMRTAEPHKDACTHWNLIVTGTTEALERIEELILAHYLEAADTDPHEYGAAEQRIKISKAVGEVAVNKIAAYATKYAFKNYSKIHKTENQANEAHACLAWKQHWHLRAFSFFGFAPITVWRQCRSKSYQHHSVKETKALVEAARNSDFVLFHELFLTLKKDLKPNYLRYKNKYGEEAKKLVGRAFNGVKFLVKNIFYEVFVDGKSYTCLKASKSSKAATEPAQILQNQPLEIPF